MGLVNYMNPFISVINLSRCLRGRRFFAAAK